MLNMIAGILAAALPKAMIAIIMPLLTEKFMTRILARLIVGSLEKLATLTNNKLDDDTIADIKTTLIEAGVINE